MIETIIENLMDSKNILLVWKTNTWKTHFIINELVPLLKKQWINFSYFSDCDELSNNKSDIYLVDEVELLFDKEFLEKMNPDENPYYNNIYLNKVKKWHKKLSWIKNTVLCIVTRNQETAIQNLLKSYKLFEWNNSYVKVIKFKK